MDIVDKDFLHLRHSVLKDSTPFSRMVIPVSYVVFKEIYSLTDMIKLCDNPEDFLNMGEALKEEVKILKEALRVVIDLHVEVQQ